MYKLVAIDLDGTLLNSFGEVSLNTRNALKNAKEKGIKIKKEMKIKLWNWFWSNHRY